MADDDRGAPIAYMVLAQDTPVQSSDGEPLGTVKRVLADTATDIFDGIVVSTGDGDRFVDAPEVAAIYERLVILTISAQRARELAEPTANPAVLEPTADDLAGSTPGDTVRSAARRTWDRITGAF
jgi:hypothetical protein